VTVTEGVARRVGVIGSSVGLGVALSGNRVGVPVIILLVEMVGVTVTVASADGVAVVTLAGLMDPVEVTAAVLVMAVVCVKLAGCDAAAAQRG
jgi:hypothetical protein